MLPVADFIAFINKNALFSEGDKILLAVSGGKDSVLMAQLFKLAGFNFSIAHCNFNLRGDESQRDESFVRLLATNLEVPFYVAHFDTKAYAKENHLSTQMAARQLRYDWFESLREEHNYHSIAVAQHQNDSIETILLNLTRGTGISGLHGILPKRGYIIRPILFLTREKIDQLIDVNNLAFVEDSSNQSDHYARNAIRHHVLPVLKEINPNLEEVFAENIRRFSETEMLMEQMVDLTRSELLIKHGQQWHLDIEKVKSLKPQKLLLFELLKDFDFTSNVVDELISSLDKQSGTSFYSKTNRITIDRNQLVISKLNEAKEAILENVMIHPDDFVVHFQNKALHWGYSSTIAFEQNPNKAFIDADLLIFPLVLRFKQDGDRFMPLGMKQFKKVSDFLISEKIPLPLKANIPILVNGNGEIIWLGGLRQDNRYKLSASTKKVVIFELLNN